MTDSHNAEPCPLTAAELRVMELLKDGRSYQEIASETGRATSTIRSQLHSAYHRLGVKSSYQAVLECMRYGWLTWSQSGDPIDAILLRIENLLRQLLSAADAHYHQEENVLTPPQRSYLEAFDARVRAHTPSELADAQRAMDRAFSALVNQAAERQSDPRRQRHLTDRFLAVVDNELERVAA